MVRRKVDEMSDANDNTYESRVFAKGSEVAGEAMEEILGSHDDTTPTSTSTDALTDAIFPVSARPIVVRTATIRPMGPRGGRNYSLVMTIPKAITDVCGLRDGDTLLVEAWANGQVRMTLAGEGL